MKKLLTFLLAAIAFVACTQNDIDELSANRVNVPETLTVGFEGGDTRIELNEALKTVWTEGDEVSVFYYSDANNKFAYQGETGERFGELKLVGRGDSVADVPGVVTVYPYNPNYKINALTANLLLNLPSKQYYKSDSYGENGNIMVAYSEFNQFMLRSIYGWLRIDITGEGQKVSTIRVKGNRGEQMAGAVHVDSSDATMTLANEQSDIVEDDELGGVGGNIVVDGAAKDVVILDCMGEVELSSEATSFYVALPPQTLAEGFTVAIYCTNGTMMTKDYTNSIEIKRNHIHPISAFKYNGMEGEEPDTNTTLPEDSDPSNTTFHHRVLLIDHVGVNCSYCPRVMSGMKALEETDWRNYYNVAEVHGGGFAPSGSDNAYSYAATVVDKFYGVSSYPNIRFNFYDGEGNIGNVTQFVSQNSAILELLVNKDGADAGIAAAAVGNDSSVSVSIGVKAAVTQEYKVTAWLLENGIYNPNQAAATEEYHKNRDHVLRYIAGEYSSNDLSGDSLGIIEEGLTAYCNYTIPIEDEWDYSNLNLLIIVSAEDENGDFDVVNTALCPVNGSVGYEYVDNNQGEEPDYPTSMTFALENIDTTSDYFSYTVDIIPSDKNTPYIVMSASPEYIEELGGTDDDIYADDYAYFEWVGSFYSQSAVEIMQARYKVGDNRGVTVSNATPGMPYIFYCYYVDYATGVRSSDIARFEITCGHPELTEVEFTMTTEVDGPGVFTDAVPVGFDGDYYTDVITAAELANGEAAGYTKEEYIKLWWANIVVDLKADYSLGDIIAMNTCKGENADGTPRSQSSFELIQNTDYYCFAFALEENALCASTPKLQAFRTGAAEPSSNEFTISVTELTARKAEVSVTATVAEVPYVTHCVTAADWAKFGNNDAERMEHILSNLGLSYCYDNVDVTYTGLEPDTNYVLFAFGTRGGVPTTGLTYEEFTTKSGNPGNATISFKDLGYFKVDDLEDYGLTFGEWAEGQAIMPVEVVISPEEHGDWWYDTYNWTGRDDEYDTQSYIESLLYWIEKYGSSTMTRTFYILEWDDFYVRVAIITDTNGQYSELYREEIVCKYEDARDPEEFVEWWNEWHNDKIELQSEVYSTRPTAKKMEVNLSAQPMAKRQKLSQQSVKRDYQDMRSERKLEKSVMHECR